MTGRYLTVVLAMSLSIAPAIALAEEPPFEYATVSYSETLRNNLRSHSPKQQIKMKAEPKGKKAGKKGSSKAHGRRSH